MNKELTVSIIKRRLRRKLKKMGMEQPFVAGSLTKIYRKCGNPNCRCATKGGQKHSAHLLTTKIKGKSKAIYVPVDMVEDVRKWCSNYSDVKDELKIISGYCEQLIKMHVKDKSMRSAKQKDKISRKRETDD
jgi:hypothetical protein